MNPLLVFLLFLKASSLSFGGLGGLPTLHQDLVSRGVSEDVFGQALAVARLSPGPNGLYMVSLGYEVGGLSGALAATAALIIPPFSILIILVWYLRVAHLRRTDNALLMLSMALAGLLGFTSWQIVRGSSTNVAEWAAGLLGFIATARFRLHPLVLIGGAAVAGIAIYH